MKIEKISWVLALGAIILQWYFMYTSDFLEIELPFSTGLLTADMAGGNVTMILFSIIPIPFILWLFSGTITSVISGYGKLYIIRDYSKSKMLIKEVGKMLIVVMVICSFTWTLFQLLRSDRWIPLTAQEHIRVMTMYALTLTGTILLQFCLEFVWGQVYAQTATLVYFTMSLFAYSLVKGTRALMLVRWICFPNLAFGMRNGAVDTGAKGVFLYSMIEIVMICSLLIYISLKFVNKKDIM